MPCHHFVSAGFVFTHVPHKSYVCLLCISSSIVHTCTQIYNIQPFISMALSAIFFHLKLLSFKAYCRARSLHWREIFSFSSRKSFLDYDTILSLTETFCSDTDVCVSLFTTNSRAAYFNCARSSSGSKDLQRSHVHTDRSRF
jgi:hypothetical protein